jgi:hypothetical protein
MARLPGIRLLLVLTAVAAALSSSRGTGRFQRRAFKRRRAESAKEDPPAKRVIDDDNLSQVMERADDGQRTGFRYLMGGETNGFQVAAPDVTCSLSFTANVKSLLTGQYAKMDLPADDLSKVQGQATVESDSLSVPIFNGTNWHVSELAVALTVIRKRVDLLFRA